MPVPATVCGLAGRHRALRARPDRTGSGAFVETTYLLRSRLTRDPRHQRLAETHARVRRPGRRTHALPLYQHSQRAGILRYVAARTLNGNGRIVYHLAEGA